MNQIPIGKAEVLREGGDIALVGFGASVAECVKAADQLAASGIEASVVNGRFAKPLDEELLLRLARTTGGIITVEENVRAGGFGDAVLALLADHHLADRFVTALTMPDEIVEHGPQTTMRERYGVDAKGIAETARAAVSARQESTDRPYEGALTPA